MKILEITAFSAGFCGVGTRVFAESELLAKAGHEVYIFSSDIKRGTGRIETAKRYEKINSVHVFRFPTKGKFGQNTFFWDYEKAAFRLKPDIIICHAYRQYYSTKALKIARKLRVPCFLVTHAPFLDKKLRSFKLNLAVSIYDTFIGKRILNKYTKILTITKWEIPSLLKLGVKRDKIIYTPNGIPEEFFKQKKLKTKPKDILFFGRIAPIKDIETLLIAFKLYQKKTNDNKTNLHLVGPIEEPYGAHIVQLIEKLKLKDLVKIIPPILDLKEKIKLLDKYELFILPSKREGMPQALAEAMARGNLIISSRTDGGKELINHGETGFLFDIGQELQLAELIEKTIKLSTKEKQKIRKNAAKYVEQFKWSKLIEKIKQIYHIN